MFVGGAGGAIEMTLAMLAYKYEDVINYNNYVLKEIVYHVRSWSWMV